MHTTSQPPQSRCRILLKQLDSKFDVSTIILACCVLHNFCQIAGQENDDHKLLQRVIELDRHSKLARREINSMVPAARVAANNTGQQIRQVIQDYL